MNTYKINNIKISVLRKYLKLKGAKKIRIKGGHEIWSHKELDRPITFQTHIDPVPGFIVSQITNYFGDTKENFHKIINSKSNKKTGK